jgi:ketopantoate reductase
MGEMGGVFARGLLRLGRPVYPVLRSDDMAERAQQIPEPAMVLVAVAEKDLHSVLDRLPQQWRDKVALLQNELLPRDWQSYGFADPTVISVWFEKKKGQDYKVLVPSPVYGPNAQLLIDALQNLSIPTFLVPDDNALLFQLVRKNVYILTTNIAGLVTGGTVDDLWSNHQTLARDVASDVIDIQEGLTQQHFDRERLIQGMVEAFHGDPQHKCMGRSAPARLANAIAHADEAKLDVPTLREISSSHT